MRSLLLWISGAALAFLVTAAAFLALAEIGSSFSERSLPPRPSRSGPSLSMNLGETQLEKLKTKPGQRLVLGLRNEGKNKLSNVSITVEVSSEDTSLSDARYYRHTLKSLPTGKYATVGFRLDLSPFSPSAPGNSDTGNPEMPRQVIEVRATAPGGASGVRTVVLPSQPPTASPPP